MFSTVYAELEVRIKWSENSGLRAGVPISHMLHEHELLRR